MADKYKSLQFDITKNIKDLEINAGFIHGLDDVLLYFMGNVIDDPSTIPATFEKFKLLLEAANTNEDQEKLKEIKFDMKERMLYTIFAIHQLLKAKALEQNLAVEKETNISPEDMQKYMAALLEEEGSPSEKLKKVMSLVDKKLS